MNTNPAMPSRGLVRGSFRDPDGFVFETEDTLYRQVNISYREDFDALMSSGLYGELVCQGLLVPHEDAPVELGPQPNAYKVIKPERLPFISYPFEWCFSQLQDAALTTLQVQRTALKRGMWLKDASAYNIQFSAGRPVFIDTLSFQRHHEGQAWAGYRQFCQHFLAPLALASRMDVRLCQLARVHMDGIPLGLASSLLPWTTRLNAGLLIHLHLHASAERRFAHRAPGQANRSVSFKGLLGLIDSLESCISGLQWKSSHEGWVEYYTSTNYDAQSMAHKESLVSGFLEQVKPRANLVWDLGANTGRFSRLASARGMLTCAFDRDPGCVERAYVDCTKGGDERLLPLLVDLTNPSGGIGWANEERLALVDRGPADLVLALAILHHLAIGNNVPLRGVAAFLARLGRHLVIEFVPKGDSQLQRLLVSRQDIFAEYDQHHFEAIFAERFETLARAPVDGSMRTLYLMRRRAPTPCD